MSKVNWGTLKNEYITDPTISFEILSKKYPVSVTAIAVRASKEKWSEQRKNALLKVNDKLIERTTDRIADFQADKLKIGKWVIGASINAMKTKEPRNFREAREGLDSGYKLATEAMGLNDKNNINILNQQNNFISLTDFVEKIKERQENGK